MRVLFRSADMARLAVGGVGFEDDRGPLAMPRGDMAVERIVTEVEDAVLIPFDADRVEGPVRNLRRRAHPVEPLRLPGPDSVGIGDATGIEERKGVGKGKSGSVRLEL